MTHNTLTAIAYIAVIHGVVSLGNAIDSSNWAWYGSFLCSVAIAVTVIGTISDRKPKK